MVATILQAAGCLVLALGVGLVYAPAGVIVLGVTAVLFGVALERSK